LAGDLNAKHPSWNSAVSNPSGEKWLQFLDRNDFEISAPQCPIHHSPVGNGDVLHIVVYKNIRLSNVIVSDILDSGCLQIIFHILDHVRTKNGSTPLEKFTDWERFQSLTSLLISPRIEINSGVETDKVARSFTAFIVSAFCLSTSKITLTDLNSYLPGLDRLLKYKKRMRKLLQETRNPGCKTAVNRFSKAIRRMIRKKTLEQWERKLANTALTPQAIWPIAKSLTYCDIPRASTAIRGLLDLKYHSKYKANAIADCLENQFTPHDLCDENHERRVEA
jgi:hypothetical protein